MLKAICMLLFRIGVGFPERSRQQAYSKATRRHSRSLIPLHQNNGNAVCDPLVAPSRCGGSETFEG